MSSWTPRLVSADRNSIQTYDALATTAGAYSGTGTWPGTCAVTNWAAVVALKTSAGRPKFVQGIADQTGFVSGGFTTFDLTMSTPATTGNWMVVDIAFGAGSSLCGCLLTDSAGNFYWPVFSGHGSGSGNFLSCWVGQIVNGGGSVLTLHVTQRSVSIPFPGTMAPFQSLNIAAHEYSGLTGNQPPAAYASTSTGSSSHVTADSTTYPVSIDGTTCTYLGNTYYNVGRASSTQINLSGTPVAGGGALQPIQPQAFFGVTWTAPDGVYLASDPQSSFGGTNILTSSVTTTEANVLLHFITCAEPDCPGVVVSGGADPLPSGCPVAWLTINEPDPLGGPNIWTDQSHRLHVEEQITFSWIVKQRGTATVPIYIAADDAYEPTIGSQVCLWDITADANYEVFSGTIDDAEVKWIGTQGDRMITLTCVSLEQCFDTIRLPALLFETQTAGAIFTALFAYAAGCPVSLGTVADGPVVGQFLTSDFPSIADMFDRLATIASFVWGVDPQDGTLYFHAPDLTPVPFTLSSEDVQWEQFTLKTERHDYRNRQILKPNSNASVTSSELFSGSGQSSFTMLRPVDQITNAWLTQNTQNSATGTFTGQPAVGDTVSVAYAATAGSDFKWSAGALFPVDSIIVDSNGYYQKCTIAAGATGGTEPAWIEIFGQITNDNLVTWQNQGPAGFADGNAADYTFTDALDNTQFGQVLIGATVAATAQNLADAINAIQSKAGVTFSLPTWENPLLNADEPAGASTIVVRNKPAGQGYIAALSWTGAAFSFDSNVTHGGVTTFGTNVITFGVEGQTTGGSIFTIVYNPGSDIVKSATPLQPGNRLQIEYKASNAGYVIVEDTADVEARAIIEGGTGKYQQSSSDDSALSLPQALQLAQQQLTAYGVIPQTFEFTTLKAGLYVGKVLSISMTEPHGVGGMAALVNGSWFVQEINAEVIPIYGPNGESNRFLPGGGHYRYTVRVIDVAQIASWIDFWLNMGGGGGSGGGSSVYAGGGSLGSSAGAATSTVSSFAELRGVPVPTAQTAVIVDGYYTPGDGGGGTFVWDGSSSATDNSGTIATPTGYTGVGRWKRVYDGAIWARWFGAKGDGTTDDSSAIAAAITAAAASWLEVAFDGSTYLCSDLSLSTDGLKLTGASGTVLKNHTAGHALLTVSANYGSIDLIQFNGNSGIGGITATVLVTGAHNRFFRCTSHSGTNQGFCLDGSATTCNFNVFESCESYSNAGIGFSANTAPDNRFVNCYSHNNNLEGFTFDVTSHRAQAVGCRVDANCQTGGVGNFGVDGSNDCVISGCVVTGAVSTSGIKTQNNTGDTDRLVITGCSFQGNGAYGVDLFAGSGGNANNCVVTGNDFEGNTSGPIRVSGAGCTGNMIAGNALNGGSISDSGTSTVIIQTAGGGYPPETANTVLAGPTSGSSSTPTFRALVVPDYPFHSESLTDGASNFIFAGGDVVTVIGVPN
jgi:hypothetical protein